jgi:hypothetical protein
MRVTGVAMYERSDLSKIPSGADQKPLITLEHNMWVLDGSFEAVDDNNIGYWSSALSDVNCVVNPGVTLTVTFTGADTYLSMGIDVCGQEPTADYATALNISWFLNDTQKATKSFNPNSADYFCELLVEQYNSLVITFNATSKPFRRVRVDRILLGVKRRFDPDQLQNAGILQELSPISNVLPISSSDFTLIDSDNINFMFQQKQPLNIYVDDQIAAYHFVEKYSRTSKSIYHISCNDLIGILIDMPFEPTMYTSDTNAKQVVLDLLSGKFQLEWDPELDAATIQGYLNVKTVRDAIQHIALCIGGVCSTANRRGLAVMKLNPLVTVPIPLEKIYDQSRVDVESPITKLIVYSHTYTETTSQKAGDDVVKVGDVYYMHTSEEISVSNENISPTAKPNIKEIRDVTLINSTNAKDIANNIFQYLLKTNTHNLTFVFSPEYFLGVNVEATTPFETTCEGILEKLKLKLSGTIAVESQYKY